MKPTLQPSLINDQYLTKTPMVFPLQVCLTLLDEIASRIGQPISTYQATKTRFSEGFTSFDTKHPMIRSKFLFLSKLVEIGKVIIDQITQEKFQYHGV